MTTYTLKFKAHSTIGGKSGGWYWQDNSTEEQVGPLFSTADLAVKAVFDKDLEDYGINTFNAVVPVVDLLAVDTTPFIVLVK